MRKCGNFLLSLNLISQNYANEHMGSNNFKFCSKAQNLGSKNCPKFQGSPQEGDFQNI